MRKFVILHANCANRGDEAAVRAMIDQLLKNYGDAQIILYYNGDTRYPNLPEQVMERERFPKLRSTKSRIDFLLCMKTCGLLCLTEQSRNFVKTIREADLILHAPGGPSIGDIYSKTEWLCLQRLLLVKRLKKKYMFYAPSMGPFEKRWRNPLRRKVLRASEAVVIRDPVSRRYVKSLIPELPVVAALDSAIQNTISEEENEVKLQKYTELKNFIKKYEKCVGITITDLQWHPVYRDDRSVSRNIRDTFWFFSRRLKKEGIGIVLIPQLYGTAEDQEFMRFCIGKEENCFMVRADSSEYDAYFQQYLIGKLYALVGMRYHSNIFAAKMGTPFLSISYEQKMEGFMEEMDLTEYCIPLKKLSSGKLWEKWKLLISNWEEYRDHLKRKSPWMIEEAGRSSRIVDQIMQKEGGEYSSENMDE